MGIGCKTRCLAAVCQNHQKLIHHFELAEFQFIIIITDFFCFGCCWCNQISICRRLTYGSHKLNCHLDSSINWSNPSIVTRLISCFGWLVYSPFAPIPCPTIDKQMPRLYFTLAIHCLLLLYSGSIASAKTKKNSNAISKWPNTLTIDIDQTNHVKRLELIKSNGSNVCDIGSENSNWSKLKVRHVWMANSKEWTWNRTSVERKRRANI